VLFYARLLINHSNEFISPKTAFFAEHFTSKIVKLTNKSRMQKRFFQLFSLSLFIPIVFMLSSFTNNKVANEEADAIVGIWKTGEANALVKIYKNGDKYEGKIVWLLEPIDPATNKPKLDKNNPDETKKTRPVVGMVNIYDFVYAGKKEWESGKIYDPKTGNEYKSTIKLKDANTLEVRGYIGVSLFGRTDVWKRQVAK
jgi:uncharacterized protein (DUF2147 family)